MAFACTSWQEQVMTNAPSPKPPAPRSAGALIALSLLAGPMIGFLYGQISIGLVAGLLLGILMAVFFWLVDRRR
jgi:hypothetical protein